MTQHSTYTVISFKPIYLQTSPCRFSLWRRSICGTAAEGKCFEIKKFSCPLSLQIYFSVGNLKLLVACAWKASKTSIGELIWLEHLYCPRCTCYFGKLFMIWGGEGVNWIPKISMLLFGFPFDNGVAVISSLLLLRSLCFAWDFIIILNIFVVLRLRFMCDRTCAVVSALFVLCARVNRSLLGYRKL